jgi:hypothetical protein
MKIRENVLSCFRGTSCGNARGRVQEWQKALRRNTDRSESRGLRDAVKKKGITRKTYKRVMFVDGKE